MSDRATFFGLPVRMSSVLREDEALFVKSDGTFQKIVWTANALADREREIERLRAELLSAREALREMLAPVPDMCGGPNAGLWGCGCCEDPKWGEVLARLRALSPSPKGPGTCRCDFAAHPCSGECRCCGAITGEEHRHPAPSPKPGTERICMNCIDWDADSPAVRGDLGACDGARGGSTRGTDTCAAWHPVPSVPSPSPKEGE